MKTPTHQPRYRARAGISPKIKEAASKAAQKKRSTQMYVARVTQHVVRLMWLGDEGDDSDMQFTTDPPNGDSRNGIHMHERLAFVDHPPPPQRLRRDEPEPDVLDPGFISAARWKTKHTVH